jgi:lon-related putative ATP-dependent protease
MDLNSRKVPLEKLRWTCNPNQFEFDTTENVNPLTGFIGQKRAIKSIEFGLGMECPGYNIYVAGLTGTGKTTIIKSFLERIVKEKQMKDQCPMPDDWCFVNNFADPDHPTILRLPRGRGKIFKAEMAELIKQIKNEITRVFESEQYTAQKKQIIEDSQRRQHQLFQELEKKANEQGFTIQSSPMGLMIIPIKEGKPLTPEQYLALDQMEREELERRRMDLMSRLSDSMKNIQAFEKEARKNVKELDQKVAQFAVEPLFMSIEKEYEAFPEVINYLKSVQENILKNIDSFIGGETQSPAPGMKMPALDQSLTQYEVNVFVDNTDTQGPPIIIETNPTYPNMFGRIEKKSAFGTYVTDFTMIKPGALSLANGGYLVVNALDILINPGVWEGLKRVIKNKEVRIEDLSEQLGFFITSGLKPQPIPTEVKIILIGNAYIYHLLYNMDEDFRRIFKVKADFDYQIPRDEAIMADYAAFISSCCQRENLKHFDRTGVAKVIEFGARIVEDQKRLSARFSDIIDIIREANYWASQDGSTYVQAEHVEKAIEEKLYRSNLIQERIQDLIEEGTFLVDVAGEKVGQLNGLAVYDLGDFSFGKPSRITAQTFMGRAGVINIERESKLSGKIHDKGVLILSGYLGDKYAQDKPLTLSTSICFEQSYEGVEGDSASFTELAAILSSLSGVAIKQGIAVTGSINQKGEIQPIGGVNQKIEGFFDICKAKGLTGEQGVIIPHQNVKHLMLKREVIEAVKEGKFHIYAIENVDQGIEILTGVEAGQRGADGSYPEGTINYLVDKRLKELAKGLKEYAAEEKPKPKESNED